MPSIEVLILTQENCHFCEMASALFGRLEREYPLSVSTLAIESADGQALAQRGGILFPPGVFINGDPFAYGRPSERKIRTELERRLATERRLTSASER